MQLKCNNIRYCTKCCTDSVYINIRPQEYYITFNFKSKNATYSWMVRGRLIEKGLVKESFLLEQYEWLFNIVCKHFNIDKDLYVWTCY